MERDDRAEQRSKKAGKKEEEAEWMKGDKGKDGEEERRSFCVWHNEGGFIERGRDWNGSLSNTGEERTEAIRRNVPRRF